MLGTNVDDLGDVRPGIAAARDRGAKMPMVDVGLTKAGDPRAVAASSACRPGTSRSSRACRRGFRTARRSRRTGCAASTSSRTACATLGFRQLRVRFHDTIARLEIDAGELARVVEVREQIVALGKQLGFAYVALDLAGFRSGSMNEVLPVQR